VKSCAELIRSNKPAVGSNYASIYVLEQTLPFLLEFPIWNTEQRLELEALQEELAGLGDQGMQRDDDDGLGDCIMTDDVDECFMGEEEVVVEEQGVCRPCDMTIFSFFNRISLEILESLVA
jgi:hypothetical protein